LVITHRFMFKWALNQLSSVWFVQTWLGVENKKTNLMSLAVLFHFLCSQHVSDVNISIIRSLRLFCWITTLVVCSWFDVCFGVVGLAWWQWCFSLQHGYHANPTTPKHQHTSNQEHTTDVVIQQNSRKLLMMDILMSETCWAHKKWNKTANDLKLVFLFSTITMMHGPINIRFTD